MDSLEALISAAESSPTARSMLRALLVEPWCRTPPSAAAWPHLAARPLAPGHALAATAQGDVGHLFVLAPEPQVGTSIPFGDEAARALALAWRLGRADAALLGAPARARLDPTWSLRRIPHPAERVPAVVDGSSLGLAASLAAASVVQGTPVPATVCALAAVTDTGEVRPVQHLEAKLSCLRAWAPGVRTVLVAPSQVKLAQDRGGLVVEGASSVAHAHGIVWPDAEASVPVPVDADEQAAALLDIALGGHRTLHRWDVVARSAERLLPRLRGNRRSQAELVRAVARRYEAANAHLSWPAEPFLDGLLEELRFRLLAHVVAAQEWAPDRRTAKENVARAHALLPSAPQASHHLQLLGAVARMEEVLGHGKLALRYARQALDGWFALRRWPDSGYALSQLLLLHGRAGATGDLERLEAEEGARFTSTPETLASQCFYQWSLGRAWILAGEHLRGAAALTHSTLRPALAPEHVRASALRWRVRAGQLTPEDAEQALEQLGGWGALQAYLLQSDLGDTSNVVGEPKVWRRVPLCFRWTWAKPESPTRAERARLAEEFLY